MPRLLEINPRAAEAIARAAEILREETAYLDMRQELEIESSDGAQILSVDSLKEHPQGLRRRLLREAVARARKGLRRVGSAHIEALESLLEEGKSGKRIELPGGATAAREFGKLIIRPTDSSNSADAREENIEETELKAGGECITELFRLEFRVSDGSKPDAPADRWSGFIDLDKTGERLLARFRRAGERYRPAGRRSMEKLKNLMIENRIPLSFRRNWPIIATVNGDFIWSPGLPPAIDFIADATAKRVGFIVANEAADREFRIEKRLRSD